MSDLPAGWVQTSLKSVLSRLIDGSHNPPARQTNGLPMLSALNVGNGQLYFDGARLIDPSDFEREHKRTKVQAGDVLLTIVGSIGRSTVVPKEVQSFTLQRSVSVKRIVSKIDDLFSHIEEGERALQRVQKLVERYRQSVLKAAVTGELTRKWRERHNGRVESGVTLLARALEARRAAWEAVELNKMKAKGVRPINDRWKQKYDAAISPDTTRLPRLPDGWVWASLDQFAAPVDWAIQSGPFGSNLLHSEFQSSGKLVIGIDNVRDGWFSAGSQNRISEEKFDQLKKYLARPKDFLITVMATVGRTCVVPEDIEPAIITKHVYRFTLNQNIVLPEFVNLCAMGCPSVRSQIFGNVQGQTRPGLNKSILIRFGFPLPPLEEQRAILDRSTELLSQISPSKASIESQQRLSESLRHAVLKAAFCGSLVRQDSVDESASDLLERLAAEGSPKISSRRRSNTKKEQVA